ncbi:Glycosyltransferase involved in cell wall bisynthesis [Orenia metallireducens]|uniref:Glycosyltransferase involved in cell wall bisynthesis n=1 Tax=Orenia metallireducens TaxID=1413210 RepID=A0A285FWX7_9FIRM|nr:glycosyltransferase [Orenia metallireducens]SNY15324.1 Glycosyltransferase involved in cell wall bisynthesis [Orenia metallireducens]
MKIAYIVSTLKRAGPTNQLSYIIKYLNRDKFDPIIITLSPEPEESLKSRFVKMDVKIESLYLSRIQGLFLAQLRLKNLLAKYNPDVIHTQGMRADFLSANYFNEYKRVCTVRNYPYYDYPMTYGKIKGIIMAKFHLNALSKIDYPMACSKSVSEMLKDNKNFDINFIQNGVDNEKFKRPTKQEKRLWREKLNISLDKKIFVSVGHLSSRKDPITIIDAFKNSKIFQGSHLIFLGDGELRNECKHAIEGYENIKLMGRVNNVNEYLMASDYFISSSLAEGLPNTVMEALSTGLPCILSNIPPHKEILSFNNRAGFLFKCKDTKVLSQIIDNSVQKEYNEMTEAAKDIIDNYLSAKIMSQKYQELYGK